MAAAMMMAVLVIVRASNAVVQGLYNRLMIRLHLIRTDGSHMEYPGPGCCSRHKEYSTHSQHLCLCLHIHPPFPCSRIRRCSPSVPL